MPDGPWPGNAALVAAVEEATGARAATVGKPEPPVFLTALDRLGPGRALMVGDRLDADVDGALAAGIDAAVVLTGATDREEAEHALAGDRAAAAAEGEGQEQRPHLVAVADSLGDLLLGAS
jgi:ribonucleotide monophosphatase NagD (HAD superfamily)